MLCRTSARGPRVCRAARESPPNGSPQRMFVFGLGYTGLAVANQLQKHGWCGQHSTQLHAFREDLAMCHIVRPLFNTGLRNLLTGVALIISSWWCT